MKRILSLSGLCITLLFLTFCAAEHENELRDVEIHIDAENRITADGQPVHLSALQTLVEENRQQHQLRFIINAEEYSCIHRINDITRIVHPDPVQFASAD